MVANYEQLREMALVEMKAMVVVMISWFDIKLVEDERPITFMSRLMTTFNNRVRVRLMA